MDGTLQGDVVHIPIGDVHPNAWNPNAMNKREFARLKKELTENGFLIPIVVVQNDDGYEIIGGEHRWRAAGELGFGKVPCVVLTGEKWSDEDVRMFETTRLNAIKGRVSPEKLAAMHAKLIERGHDEKLMSHLMGFAEEAEFKRLIKATSQSMRDAGAPTAAVKEFEANAQQLKSVDGLSDMLERIWKRHGSSAEKSYIAFDFGGRKHIWIGMSHGDMVPMSAMMEDIQASGTTASKVFGWIAKHWKDIPDLRDVIGNQEGNEEA